MLTHLEFPFLFLFREAEVEIVPVCFYYSSFNAC